MKNLYIALLLFIGACGGGTPKVNPDLSGTFEGTGQGRNGDIAVSVTVDKGIITGINIVESAETPEYAAASFEPIVNAILENNNINIEAVSGASLASGGLIEAVSNALAQTDTSFSGKKIKTQ